MKPINEHIVEIAQSDLVAGYGEEGANNSGPWILKIMRGISGAWCTGWVCDVIPRAWSKWLWQFGGENGVAPKIWLPTYTRSARNLFNQFDKAGKLVEIPQPGDIVFMSRKGAPWMGHCGIVEAVNLLNFAYIRQIVTIEGNLGPYPAKLKRRSYRDYMAVPQLLGYGRVG